MSSSAQISAIFLLIIGIFRATNCFIPDQAPDSDLPSGFVEFPDVNVAYKVYTEKLSWDDAARKCNEVGGQLALIDTRRKISHIAGIKPNGAYVWVGIKRTEERAPWRKISDGSPMVDVPWAPGKPTAGSNNCLTVRGCNRGLSNERCTQRKVFACEISLIQQGLLQS
ncbi:CD209 antigen-like protein A [Athalia rosae]|uniref:CD209 antigen-like protein A n=1 Tax=Athalia rosae TaxID=37344 RepID=UPI0020344228|nr:CD209 antigen-like protein A [Athalia rosae]